MPSPVPCPDLCTDPRTDRRSEPPTRPRRGVAWGLSIALMCAASALPVRADEPAAPEPLAEQVAPNVWFAPGVPPAAPNLAFVVTNKSVVLIDAPATAPGAAQWLAQVRRVTLKPVSHVLLTRPAADAAEGLEALKAAGAVVVAQRGATPAAAESAPQPIDPADGAPRAAPDEPAVRGSAAELWLDDSADLLIGGMHFQAQRLGAEGVASGLQRIVYLLPDEAVLFAGALVTPDAVPDIGRADTRAWIAALDELLKLDAQLLLAKLGAPASPAAAALQATRGYLAWLRESMGEALRRDEPFDAAYDKTDWSRYAALAQFEAFNRANASATYLRMQRDGG